MICKKSLCVAVFINISVSDTFRHILQHRKISHSIGAINHMSSNIAKKFWTKIRGEISVIACIAHYVKEELLYILRPEILPLKKEVNIIELSCLKKMDSHFDTFFSQFRANK